MASSSARGGRLPHLDLAPLPSRERLRVVVAGGGVGGLETLVALNALDTAARPADRRHRPRVDRRRGPAAPARGRRAVALEPAGARRGGAGTSPVRVIRRTMRDVDSE
jgi:hypothetical protein